jgi:murein DD-endopeptidase MepM/ murein hydrolase activator NlpD
VSSPFGRCILPNKPLAGTLHNGIDLPAPIGVPWSQWSQELLPIQRHGVGGLRILIQHDRFIGVYSHLGMIVDGRAIDPAPYIDAAPCGVGWPASATA